MDKNTMEGSRECEILQSGQTLRLCWKIVKEAAAALCRYVVLVMVVFMAMMYWY